MLKLITTGNLGPLLESIEQPLTVLFSYLVDNKNIEIQRTNPSLSHLKQHLKKSVLLNSLFGYMFPIASVIMVWKHLPKQTRSKAVRSNLHVGKCLEVGEETQLGAGRKVYQPC